MSSNTLFSIEDLESKQYKPSYESIPIETWTHIQLNKFQLEWEQHIKPIVLNGVVVELINQIGRRLEFDVDKELTSERWQNLNTDCQHLLRLWKEKHKDIVLGINSDKYSMELTSERGIVDVVWSAAILILFQGNVTQISCNHESSPGIRYTAYRKQLHEKKSS